MTLIGKKNRYTCRECGGHIITIDRDAGTSPAFIKCRASSGCPGMMITSMYDIEQTLPARYEWYRPGSFEVDTITNVGVLQHLAKGGLLLREAVSEAGHAPR